ncbi:MAG: ECA polysaccharide chain length modulation protein [Arsenophonus endosymbiont of Dermacentor nuttalli]
MTKSETQPKSNSSLQSLEYELDIRSLFCALWQGKIWIISLAFIFAAVALIVSYMMQEKWSANAVTDLPTINNLGAYYSQQQFLLNLDSHINETQDNQLPTIANEVYQEFTVQVGSYDTRREFWLNNDYYKTRMEGNSKADAELLDELIDNIQFTPKDDDKILDDNIKLVAETAADANQLLREYISFANKRASFNLNEQIKGAWAAKEQSLKALVKRQEMAAKAIYQRRLNALQQSLKVAQKQGISSNKVDVPIDQLANSEMFLLGTSLLQAQIETLQATGPNYDENYDQNMAMLATLNVAPALENNFQTYRYLRTPEDPVKRDSPRRVLMMVIWGMIGALSGVGITLLRRKT